MQKLSRFFRKQIVANQRGLTMVELLIVTGIIAILLILSILSIPRFMVQSWDAKRQDDLVKLKTALEHYYQDTGCYPSPELISQCGGDGLEPYLNSMLCDPRSNQPYAYYRSGCHTYRLLTTLEYDSNPAIAQSGCTLGCGADLTGDGQGDFNYGVSSPNVTLAGRPPICILDGVAHCAIVGEGGCCPGNMSCDVDNAWCVFNGAGE